jgi:transketolase
MTICLPSDWHVTKKLVKFLVDYDKPCYVRVGRAAVPDVYSDDDFTFEVGKAITVVDGTDLTIVATGETVWHAWQAALQLKEQGIAARVLDCSWLKPFDEEAIRRAAHETGRIITVEEHSRFGGLGAMVCEVLSEQPVPVRIIGIPDENVVHGTNAEIFHHYGMDAEGIVRATLSFLATPNS